MVSPEEEERELFDSFHIDLETGIEGEDDEDLEARPPVVTVMGHVDHGKTRLLDAIRNEDVAGGETGGITQHIGAYQVHREHEGVDRPITFIDTPGHEAFTAMRARGAKVTDIAILVVAADDGVMPQTIEALNHTQAADVPIVVAVNKIDVEGANPSKVRQQLTEYNLVAEEYGGETMFVDVSAKQGLNIDQLLEAVLLTADAALDLRANPDREARGIAIEANLDKGRGATATVLVQTGTLHVGDAIVAGSSHGRVRAMLDEHGNAVPEAGPSRPVQVLGLSSVPRAGDTFVVAPDDRTARQIAEKREAADRQASLAKARKRISLEDLNEALAAGKVETLNLILKGDVSGSVEALEDALLQIDVGEEVDLRIIDRGVGAITLNNINLAMASDAIIIGFNVRAEGQNAEVAEREGVEIRYYSVIYQAIDEIEQALKGMLKPEFEEVELGTARDPRDLPVQQVRQHRRLDRPQRRDQARHPGADHPQRGRRRRERRDRRPAPVQGRRHRGPRGLRVRHQPGVVQRPPDRGPHRDVRDAREAARVMRRAQHAWADARGPRADRVGPVSGRCTLVVHRPLPSRPPPGH